LNIEDIEAMLRTLSTAILLLAVVAGSAAETHAQADPIGSDSDSIAVASMRSLRELLPDDLAGTKATAGVEEYGPIQFVQLVGDNADVYREYKVINAAARQYGQIKVEVFQTASPFAAYGIFSYVTSEGQPSKPARQVGLRSALVPEGLVFCQGNLLIRVLASGGRQTHLMQVADSVSRGLGPVTKSHVIPPLLDSLPQGAVAQNPRYFLGPRALSPFVHHAGEMFGFGGQAEAVLTRYRQAGSGRAASPLRVLIVEYHTPQFAIEAISRATEFLASLPQDEQSHIVLKREGNYIIEASEVQDRARAEQLVGEVKYPYGVKWLQNELRPRRRQDPRAGQKVAQILISDFGIIGLGLAGALVGGIAFGAYVFVKRRKQQREIFSDAGGMLRLDIKPLGGVSSLRITGGAGGDQQ
jgi:hypothetical protein